MTTMHSLSRLHNAGAALSHKWSDVNLNYLGVVLLIHCKMANSCRTRHQVLEAGMDTFRFPSLQHAP